MVDWQEVGTVVLLQLQLDRMKIGEKPQQTYVPEGKLYHVQALQLEPQGVSATIDSQVAYDVHHANHPRSRHRSSNAVSFGLTSHYARMRDRFGDQFPLGIAGENIILDVAEPWFEADLAGVQVAFQRATGELTILRNLSALEPCEPFTSYCLGADAAPAVVKDTLQFLRQGTRGFCGELVGPGPHTVSFGDRVLIAR